MTSQYMHLIILQDISQLTGIAYISLVLYAVPYGSMHIEDNQRTLGNKTQITFQPIQISICNSLDILLVAHVIDVLQSNNVNLADVIRIIGWSEETMVILLTIYRSAESHIMQILITLVEIMIADTLESGHPDAIKRSGIFTIKVHAVKDQVAQGICHYLTLAAQSINISLQIADRFLLPAVHIMLILDLRVGDGNIIELIRWLFPFFQNEIMPAIILYKLVNTNIKALCKTLLTGKNISRRSRNADELADIGISRQGPFSLRIGLYKTPAVIYYNTGYTLTLTVFYLAGENKRRSLLGSNTQWHCPNKR